MLHARSDYNRIQDPAIDDPSLLSEGSSPIAEDEPVFLVRASDQAFVQTLSAWIKAHNDAKGDPLLTDAVARHITIGVNWQNKNQCKVADAPASVLTKEK